MLGNRWTTALWSLVAHQYNCYRGCAKLHASFNYTYVHMHVVTHAHTHKLTATGYPLSLKINEWSKNSSYRPLHRLCFDGASPQSWILLSHLAIFSLLKQQQTLNLSASKFPKKKYQYSQQQQQNENRINKKCKQRKQQQLRHYNNNRGNLTQRFSRENSCLEFQRFTVFVIITFCCCYWALAAINILRW